MIIHMLNARYVQKMDEDHKLIPMTDDHCVVCFESLFESHQPCVMHNENNCNGVFHFACLKRWFGSNPAQTCLNCNQPATIFVFMDPQERVPIYGKNAIIREPLGNYRTLDPSDTDVWVDDTGRRVLTNVGFSAKYALRILDVLLSGVKDDDNIVTESYETDLRKSVKVGSLAMDEYEDDVRVEVMVQHFFNGEAYIYARIDNNNTDEHVIGYFTGVRRGHEFVKGQSKKLINDIIL